MIVTRDSSLGSQQDVNAMNFTYKFGFDHWMALNNERPDKF